MAKKMSKPATLGTVWTATARIQVIEERGEGVAYTARWVTLAECIDTPNAIKAAVTQLSTATGRSLWVKHQYGEREYLGNR